MKPPTLGLYSRPMPRALWWSYGWESHRVPAFERLLDDPRKVDLVQGSTCRVQGSGFRIQGSGFRVQDAGFRVQGSGSGVQGSGFRVQCLGFEAEGLGSGVREVDQSEVRHVLASHLRSNVEFAVQDCGFRARVEDTGFRV